MNYGRMKSVTLYGFDVFEFTVFFLCLPGCMLRHSSPHNPCHIFSFARRSHSLSLTLPIFLRLSLFITLFFCTFGYFFRFVCMLLLLFPFHLIFTLTSCYTIIDLGSNFGIHFIRTHSTRFGAYISICTQKKVLAQLWILNWYRHTHSFSTHTRIIVMRTAHIHW